MAVRLLGPLQVEVDGVDVPVGPPRERAVLACLALDAGRVVAEDRLLDALWGDAPPASARGTLQTYVSHLRRALAPAVVERIGAGYLLDGAGVDVAEVDRAVADLGTPSIDPVDRAELAEAVLELWRGEPLADLGDDPAVVAIRRRLEESRLQVADALVDARLRLGQGDRVLGLLDELCTAHPLRERFAAQQVLAYYRAGRQAEALAAYQRLRHDLVEHLGIDPTPEVRQLEGQILAQDPALLLGTGPGASGDPPGSGEGGHLPLPLPGRLVAGRGDATLVGRRHQLDRLVTQLARAEADGVPEMCLVVGEAGIGKTRLARELALIAAGRQDVVLWGRCPADGGGAFQAVAEALDHLVRHRPALTAGLDGPLGPLLPSLGASVDPLLALGSGEEQRFALLAAVEELLARASRDRATVVVLDDLQWADAGTLAVVEHLHTTARPGLLVVATIRVPEPTEAPVLAAAVGRMERDRPLCRVSLEGLSPNELRVLLDRATGGAAPEASVLALHDQTGGNPFFAGEVLAELGAGAADALASGSVPVPAGVSAMLAQRLDHLSAGDEAVLTAAAVLGAEFDLAAVAEVAHLSEEAALTSLERAMALGLVDEADGSLAFTFVHALVRAAVQARATRARWSLLAERAEAVAAGRAAARPDELGRRIAGRLLAADLTAGGSPSDDRVSTSRAMLERLSGSAGPDGIDLRDPVSAFPLTTARAGRTVLRLTEALVRRGELAAARQRLVEVGVLAQRLEEPELAVDAALALADVTDLWAGSCGRAADPTVADQVGAVVRSAGGCVPPDDPRRARLLVHLAVAQLDGAAAAGAGALADAAVAAARRCGDGATLAEALLVGRAAGWAATSPEDRLAVLDEVRDALAGSVAGPRTASCLTRSAVATAADRLAAGDLTGAARAARAIAASAEAGTEAARRWLPLVQAGLELWWGREAAAATQVERAATQLGNSAGAGRRADDPLAVLLLLLARAQGRLALSRSSTQAMADHWPSSLLWRAAAAVAHAEAGDLDAATAVLDGVAATGLAGHALDGTWLGGVALLAGPVADVGHPLAGDVAAALRPHAGQVAVAGWVGAVATVDASLTAVT